MITVVIFEEMSMIQTCLHEILSAIAWPREEFCLLAQTSDREKRCRIITEQAPDLVIIDLDCEDAFEQIRIVQELSAFSQIVVGASSAKDAEQRVANALAAGAMAYFWKQDTVEHICDTLRAANHQHVSLDPVVATIIKARLEDSAPQRMTAQERVVLEALEQGLIEEEILQRYALTQEMFYSRLGNVVIKLATTLRQPQPIDEASSYVVHPSYVVCVANVPFFSTNVLSLITYAMYGYVIRIKKVLRQLRAKTMIHIVQPLFDWYREAGA